MRSFTKRGNSLYLKRLAGRFPPPCSPGAGAASEARIEIPTGATIPARLACLSTRAVVLKVARWHIAQVRLGDIMGGEVRVVVGPGGLSGHAVPEGDPRKALEARGHVLVIEEIPHGFRLAIRLKNPLRCVA